MTGNLGGIAVRPETKSDQVEQMLRYRVIGRGIQLRPEPMRRLDLLQNKVRELVAGIDATRNLCRQRSCRIRRAISARCECSIDLLP